jgi:hypothetical protein
MIYAEISPAAQKTEQVTPFSSVTKTANYIYAYAREYSLGSDKVNFNVVYGTPFFSGDTVLGFEGIIINEVTLESSELSTWGTDDRVIYNQIANKVGFTIVNTATGVDIV